MSALAQTLSFHGDEMAHDCLVRCGEPEIFDAIKLPHVAAALWTREPLAEFQTWIDAVPAEKLPVGRLTLRPDAVRDAVAQLCKISWMEDTSQKSMLINDVVVLTELFAKAMETAFVKLRLEAVDDDGCTKFHQDAVTARLLCTYRGTGTEYGVSSDDAEPGHVETVPTGAPFIMRGKLWPEQPQSGFVHRSPPMEGTGETRLVLVLDPADDPEAFA